MATSMSHIGQNLSDTHDFSRQNKEDQSLTFFDQGQTFLDQGRTFLDQYQTFLSQKTHLFMKEKIRFILKYKWKLIHICKNIMEM